MKHPCTVLTLLLLSQAGGVCGQTETMHSLDSAAGKALFEKNWVPAPASTRASDGLGPHFSQRSCAACHPGAARGTTPDTFTLQTDDPVYGRRLHGAALALVPREADIQWQQTPEGGWQLQLGTLAYGALQSPVSVRIAPSLYGLGLLEAVPLEVLRVLEDPDDTDGNGISGRIAWVERDATGRHPGRFGWKASTYSLDDQAAQALSLDIGISSERHPAPWGDCSAAQTACRALAESATEPDTIEADTVVTSLLVTYLESLRQPPGPDANTSGKSALDLFQRIGCAACHVPVLPSALGEVRAFTDLLLHDMGKGLDDGLAEGAAASAEWRTAPLWDLPVQGPFLHDGRAGTLEAAIGLHGGEAQASAEAYRVLNAQEKADLNAFLLRL